MELDPKFSGAIAESVQTTIDGQAVKWNKKIAEHVQKTVHRLRKDRLGFERRLAKRWASPMAKLETLYWLSIEIGSQTHQRRRRRLEDLDIVLGVLVQLHARGCLLMSEIISLIASGHAGGAMARWRALHETAAVALFLKEHGAEVATRYVHHDLILSAKGAREYQLHHSELGYESFTVQELAELETRVEELRNLYGTPFVNSDYGWAHVAIFGPNEKKRRVSFKQIEEAVGLQHLRPFYRMAGHGVHANPKAITWQMGLAAPTRVLLAGPTNTGFADPAQGASISLCQINTALVGYGSSDEEFDLLASVKALIDLAIDLADEFVAVQKEIEIEEMKGRSADV